MIDIIPAIMPDSFKDLSDKASLVVPYVSMVQVDIMDGKFVRSRSWPYFANDKHSFDNLLTESEGLPHWETLDYEIDLMVSKPEDVIESWINIGASRIVIHVESTQKLDEIIKMIRERFWYEGMTEAPDVEIGLALNLDTPTDTILPYLEDIQFVQFMGIQSIGLQGEPFQERVIDKIRDLHNAHPEVIITVDGGVSFDNAKILAEIGVKRLVSGSAIFEKNNIGESIKYFQKLV